MPGIVGIIGPGVPAENAALLQRMLARLLHEVSDTSATYVNQAAGVCVGSVQADPSRATGLIWNERKDVGCLIAGENDAASLIQLYEKLGTRALEQLNGWFSGVLVDLRERKTILFNDRYGLQRVYVHQTGERLFFSSEAKSLLAVLPDTRRFDPRGFAEWFSCGCALQNRSLFSGIALLPAGSCWTFSPHGLAKDRYFTPEVWESHPTLEPAAFVKRLQEVFPQALQRTFQGTARKGMSLTGGLDGRMIMAWSPSGPGELPCYTFNGPVRDCADVRIARRVAGVCGQPHQTIPVGEEFLNHFPELAAKSVWLTDGAMDVTGAVELYVNRLAREIAPVRITGNYGSEILRRHIMFKPRKFSVDMLTPDFAALTGEASRTYNAEAEGHRLSFIAFKQVPWHHYARLAVEQSQLTVRSPFLDNELVALAYQAPPECAMALEPSLQLIAAGNPQLAQLPTDRGVTYPALNRWRQFFHDSVAKAEYAYDYGMPQWLARVDRALTPLHLERLFLGWQKFYHFRIWYRRQLASYIQEVLLDSRSNLNRRCLEKMVKAHVTGAGNFTLEIHKALTLELIHRQLLETS